MKQYNTIIIGAGPAGIQLAYFLQQRNRDYLLVEGADKPANFFRHYPRHRKLLSINKRFTGKEDTEFNLRHDWNSLLSNDQDLKMSDYSQDFFPNADDLVTYLEDFVTRNKLNIAYNLRVTMVDRINNNRLFQLKTEGGEVFQCQRLVIATGIEKPYIPNIPGIELATGYEEMSLDPSIYQNKYVLIIGKGNSALETADHLISHAAIIHIISPTPVKFAWDTRYVGNIRAINNNFFDTYHLKSQNASMDGTIIKIWKNPDSEKIIVRFQPTHAPQEIEQLHYDFVLCCTGFKFNHDIFSPSCQPQLTPCGKLPAMRENFESINIENLFYAGTITQMLDYKKSQSAFIHGFRYNVRSLFYFLEERYEHQPWPTTTIDYSAKEIAISLAKYFNNVSSLWQQSKFLADVLLPKNGKMLWHHDIPYEYIKKHSSHYGNRFYIIMFRIAPCEKATFAHSRTSDVYEGEQNNVIHPVIEFYEKGKIVDKFHVLEDLLSDWSGKEYVESIESFFKATMAGKKWSDVQKEKSDEKDSKFLREIIRDEKMKLKSSVL